MGDVVHLDDEHKKVQMLLPWRANGALEPEEYRLVEAHLGECEECRRELAEDQALREHYLAAPVQLTQASEPSPRIFPPSVMRRHRRLPRIVAWPLLGSAAAAAAVALFLAVPRTNPDDEYHLLASGGEQAPGNAIVLFSPDIAQRDLRAALNGAGAQVVAGPTASGAFVIRVEQDQRTAALESLRGNEQVLLAEPLDQAP